MSENANIDSVVDILDQIIDLVSNARGVPMSASVIVNKSELLDLAQAARDQVPAQVVRADGVLASLDKVRGEAEANAAEIRSNAQAEAERIVAEARARAGRLTSADAITVAARSEAQRITDEAKGQAEALRAGADKYADDTLADLEVRVSALGRDITDLDRKVRTHVDAALHQITSGRDVLAGRGQEEPDEEPAQ